MSQNLNNRVAVNPKCQENFLRLLVRKFTRNRRGRIQVIDLLKRWPEIDLSLPNSSGFGAMKATVMYGRSEDLLALLEAGAQASPDDVQFISEKYPHKEEMENILRSWLLRSECESAIAEVSF